MFGAPDGDLAPLPAGFTAGAAPPSPPRAPASPRRRPLCPVTPRLETEFSLATSVPDDGPGEPPLTASARKRRNATTGDFDLLCVIGMGAFGRVLQVRSKLDGQVYAMKVISKKLLRRKNSVENMVTERSILTRVDHPFVVRLQCSFSTDSKLFLVMDYMHGGELFFHLRKAGLLLNETARFYVGEILLALEHLHSKGIIHRDLKPENVLMGSDGHAVLTDFGLAKDFRGGAKKEPAALAAVPVAAASDAGAGAGDGDGGGAGTAGVGAPGAAAAAASGSNAPGGGSDGGGGGAEAGEERARTLCGTTEYMAPEMLKRTGYGNAVDFWSLGALMFEMMTGGAPFTARSTKDIEAKILKDKPKFPGFLQADAVGVMKGLLEKNPVKRLGATKGTMFELGGVAVLKAHKFFKGLSWAKLLAKQIAPPLSITVDSDGDVSNFDTEFTGMDVPESISEASSACHSLVGSPDWKDFSWCAPSFTVGSVDGLGGDLGGSLGGGLEASPCSAPFAMSPGGSPGLGGGFDYDGGGGDLFAPRAVPLVPPAAPVSPAHGLGGGTSGGISGRDGIGGLLRGSGGPAPAAGSPAKAAPAAAAISTALGAELLHEKLAAVAAAPEAAGKAAGGSPPAAPGGSAAARATAAGAGGGNGTWLRPGAPARLAGDGPRTLESLLGSIGAFDEGSSPRRCGVFGGALPKPPGGGARPPGKAVPPGSRVAMQQQQQQQQQQQGGPGNGAWENGGAPPGSAGKKSSGGRGGAGGAFANYAGGSGGGGDCGKPPPAPATPQPAARGGEDAAKTQSGGYAGGSAKGRRRGRPRSVSAGSAGSRGSDGSTDSAASAGSGLRERGGVGREQAPPVRMPACSEGVGGGGGVGGGSSVAAPGPHREAIRDAILSGRVQSPVPPPAPSGRSSAAATNAATNASPAQHAPAPGAGAAWPALHGGAKAHAAHAADIPVVVKRRGNVGQGAPATAPAVVAVAAVAATALAAAPESSSAAPAPAQAWGARSLRPGGGLRMGAPGGRRAEAAPPTSPPTAPPAQARPLVQPQPLPAPLASLPGAARPPGPTFPPPPSISDVPAMGPGAPAPIRAWGKKTVPPPVLATSVLASGVAVPPPPPQQSGVSAPGAEASCPPSVTLAAGDWPVLGGKAKAKLGQGLSPVAREWKPTSAA